MLVNFVLLGAVLGARYHTVYPEPNSKNTNPLTAEKLLELTVLGTPKANPNGDTFVFTSREYFPSVDKSVVSILSRSVSDNTVTNHTATIGKSLANPLWLDNDTILFTSKTAILSYNVKQKAAPKVWYNGTLAINSFKYQSNANALIFASDVEVNPDTDKKFDNALVYDELLMRHWDHWNGRTKSHLFTLNITPEGKVTGEPKDLLKGTPLESPVEYSGGPGDYVISPDGKLVAFGAKKPGRDQAWETEQNIHLVAFDGSSAITDLTTDNQGASTAPLFSPDGKYLSFFQMAHRAYESDRNDIFVYDIQAKTKKEIAHKWDRTPNSQYWALDSSKLVIISDDEGKGKLFTVDIKSEEVTKLDTPHTVTSVSPITKDSLLLTISSFGHPNEIFTLGADGKNLKQLTDVNTEKLKGIYLSDAEEFWFTGANGDDVQGWLLKPINFDPSKKYPVAVIIHGGPQSSYNDRFFTYHNFNLHASAGQIVVTINYHASKGYGQKFIDSVNKEWAGLPIEDHHKGLDYLIAKYPWFDGSRVCTAGTSMGGYYGNWFNGHTKRFKCIIQANGMFDGAHWYYTTDEKWFPEYDNAGTPYTPGNTLDKWSPSNAIANWTTPTLVVQGELDYRIDQSEGLATFTALQRQGVPSRLLFFPDETHGVGRLPNLIRFGKETVGWISKWTQQK
jgi:acylaminoacyl-peptidase